MTQKDNDLEDPRNNTVHHVKAFLKAATEVGNGTLDGAAILEACVLLAGEMIARLPDNEEITKGELAEVACRRLHKTVQSLTNSGVDDAGSFFDDDNSPPTNH
jgi:hypothetical protein